MNKNACGATNLTLLRTHPDGQESPPIHGLTVSKVRMYIAMSLDYNGVLNKKDAFTFSDTVTAQPAGTKVTHSSGYAYTVLKGARKSAK